MNSLDLLLEQIRATLNKALEASPSHLCYKLAETYDAALNAYLEDKDIPALNERVIWTYRAVVEGSIGDNNLHNELMRLMQQLSEYLPD